jgi:hypothetical protein
LAVAVCAAAVVGVGASSAFAGEVTGNGKPLWIDPATHELNGNSPCAYSGLNLIPEDPSTAKTQTWSTFFHQQGLSPSELKGSAPSPGFACNPNNNFLG